MNWQPIETAPKDGTAILAILGTFEPAVARWCPERQRFAYIFEDDFENPETWETFLIESKDSTWKPTHWQTLPCPPTT